MCCWAFSMPIVYGLWLIRKTPNDLKGQHAPHFYAECGICLKSFARPAQSLAQKEANAWKKSVLNTRHGLDVEYLPLAVTQ